MTQDCFAGTTPVVAATEKRKVPTRKSAEASSLTTHPAFDKTVFSNQKKGRSG
jgi:hypothetical protein